MPNETRYLIGRDPKNRHAYKINNYETRAEDKEVVILLASRSKRSRSSFRLAIVRPVIVINDHMSL